VLAEFGDGGVTVIVVGPKTGWALTVAIQVNFSRARRCSWKYPMCYRAENSRSVCCFRINHSAIGRALCGAGTKRHASLNPSNLT